MARVSALYELTPTEGGDPSVSLVLVHGFMGRPRMWDPFLAALGLTGPVARAVLPGHGPAPWTAPAPEFASAVDALAAAWPVAGRAWLLGYSMGARVALGVLARHPARVAGAVLVGVDPGLTDPSARAERVCWDQAQAARLESIGLEAFVREWEALPLFATEARLDPTARARRRAERMEHTATGLAWAMRALGLGGMPSLWGTLAAGVVPVHLVTGALDEKFTALAVRAAGLGRRVVHHVVPGVGHHVALEAPDALAGLVRDVTFGAGAEGT
jgi:2-succinyl-6-hydroxy-2,4-cyclohexadiene-1-carboxylate synthase